MSGEQCGVPRVAHHLPDLLRVDVVEAELIILFVSVIVDVPLGPRSYLLISAVLLMPRIVIVGISVVIFILF